MTQKAKLIKCDITIDPEGIKYPRLHVQYLIETKEEKKLVDIPEAILPLRPDLLAIKAVNLSGNIPIFADWLMLTDDKCYMNYAKGEFSKDQKYAFAEKELP